MILCGDIGGTGTRLAHFRRGRPLEPVGLVTYPSRSAADLQALLTTHLATAAHPVEVACFAIAGPIVGGRVETTNLPWVVDAAELGAHLDGVPVLLLNDLEALAHGVGLLSAERLAVLNTGRAVSAANAAVIAAGSGLGEAGLMWDGTRHLPFASEGGHADFAPRSERELALLRHLLGRFDHVSYERLLSGSGLVRIFEFLRDAEGYAVPAPLAAALGASDPAVAISTAALAGTAPIAAAALDLFARIYGAEAGNLALKLKALAGVYVGGGIAPRILAKLADGSFRDAFVAKGRFRALLADIPVHVVLDQHAGLYGAARYADTQLDAVC